jgi:anti-sigma-K factor RskA
MRPSILDNDRLVNLLVQRAIDGTLNASERMELKQLLEHKPYGDSDLFDQTAAALLIAGAPDDEPMPKALRNRLMQQAGAFTATAPRAVVTSIGSQRVQPAPQILRPAKQAQVKQVQVVHEAAPQEEMFHEIPDEVAPVRRFAAENVAWFAMAASLVLAIIGWWPRFTDDSQQVAQAPSVQEQREQLAAKPSVVRRNWTATSEPAAQGAKGDVVWDPETQQGYVRFSGLAPNDPRKQQYQLWIFDAARGDKYPVDGGIFDIPPNAQGEIVVPIQARLPVRDAAMFAVTLERAGGVVVSEREHIVVLAKVASG